MLTEKSLQTDFVAYLKNNNWTIWEQLPDESKKNRADIIAFREDVDCYIRFELKVYKKISTYTKALKQIIRYQRTVFPVNPSLWCIVSQPEPESKIPVRFMWRFGVGVCWFPSKNPSIGYINSLSKDTIFLNKKYWRKNTPENTSRLAKKIQKEYVDYDK